MQRLKGYQAGRQISSILRQLISRGKETGNRCFSGNNLYCHTVDGVEACMVDPVCELTCLFAVTSLQESRI
ncbi:MAG: hypothetical protein GQ467_02855 [Mariprofundaceae bacterium]|nr:hypothetical protein [Mariprofundaceae bacterium]